MKHVFLSALTTIALMAAPSCFANMSYNPEHDEALNNLSSIESANLNMHYQCGKFSLFISTFATATELNGKNASVTGKITSATESHDISDMLMLAISRHDVLTGRISAGCNAEKGAFRLEIHPNNYAVEEAGTLTVINVFADGTVEGSRSVKN